MQNKIGKVRNYEGGVGNIITPEKKYVFLDTDVKGEVENDDLVMFGDENRKDRAFFVRKLSKKSVVSKDDIEIDK